MTKNIQGACAHCGMSLEFRADDIGTTAKCPYCRKETELRLAVPAVESGIPRKALVWTGIAVGILILGLIGAFAALKRAQNWASQHQRTTPAATNMPSSHLP